MSRQNVQAQNEPTDAAASAASPGSKPLSLRQLAAVRLLVRGYGSVLIAEHLKINHHTIGRWKRDPRFAGEVQRVRQFVTDAMTHPPHPPHQASAAAPTRPASPAPLSHLSRASPSAPPRPTAADPPVSNREMRETEAIINRMLAGKR